MSNQSNADQENNDQSEQESSRKKKLRWYFLSAGVLYSASLSVIGTVATDIAHGSAKPLEIIVGAVLVSIGIMFAYELRGRIDELKKKSGVSVEENSRLILAELKKINRLMRAIIKKENQSGDRS